MVFASIMKKETLIQIEIVSAYADRIARETLRVQHGVTLGEALATSAGELAQQAAKTLESVAHVADSNVGIWGRRVLADAPLNDGDRIEIYREVTADAKSARLARAREQGYRWQGRTRRAASAK